ncbi:hypothetical protein BHE74_00001697 [Ensete ventricosum]|nr:hypothetical protein BHE74_00001697 [Ensete ventricosum]
MGEEQWGGGVLNLNAVGFHRARRPTGGCRLRRKRMAEMRLGRRNILVAAYGSARFWRVPLRASRSFVGGGRT